MPRFYCYLLLGLVSACAAAQRPTAQAPTPKNLSPSKSAPPDLAKLAAAIQTSYYHPDNLQSLHCSISVDWASLLAQTKTTVSDERMQLMQGLKVDSQAVRGKDPQLNFEWTNGTFNTKEQMESGLREMVGGFYKMYWPMFAGPLVKTEKEFNKVEPLSDGSNVIYESDGNTDTTITVDKSGVPTHFAFDGPAGKGTIDSQYSAAPQNTPGDVRLLSSIVVKEQMGSSNFNIQVDVDYQEVGGFKIPRHVSFDVVGAYAIKMDFTNCSVNSIESSGSPN